MVFWGRYVKSKVKRVQNKEGHYKRCLSAVGARKRTLLIYFSRDDSIWFVLFLFNLSGKMWEILARQKSTVRRLCCHFEKRGNTRRLHCPRLQNYSEIRGNELHNLFILNPTQTDSTKCFNFIKIATHIISLNYARCRTELNHFPRSFAITLCYTVYTLWMMPLI